MEVATPRPADARRFGLLDVMILVGSVAAGFGLLRAVDPVTDWGDLFRTAASKFVWDRNYFREVVPNLVFFAMPPVMATTACVLALRLRNPRPRWRRLRRQPGFVACLAVALSWMLATPVVVASVLLTNSPPVDLEDIVNAFLMLSSALGGCVVIVAWSTQALVGRWKPEPTWPDRLGRLVGLGWVGLSLAGEFVLPALGL